MVPLLNTTLEVEESPGMVCQNNMSCRKMCLASKHLIEFNDQCNVYLFTQLAEEKSTSKKEQ